MVEADVRRWIASLVVVLCAAGAVAAPVPGEDGAKSAKSLKERLSDKASDEQRVDNCRVPLDRRGTKPRPDCPEQRQDATSPPPAATQ
jgi:hypothetical protein